MDRELQRLIDDYLEGEASPKQVEQLEAQLRSPDVLAEFVEQSHLHRQLHDTLLAGANHQIADLESPAGTDANILRAGSQQIVSFFTRPSRLSIAVATLIIGVLVTVMSFLTVPLYRGMTRQISSSAQQEVVAQVTAMRDVEWGAGQVALERNSLLRKGQRITLQSGLMLIHFQSGATIALEGPVDFAPIDEMAGKLNVGKLTAQVPRIATGFAVSTPTSRIVDLGTEFGVKVERDNVTEVVVITGVVEVATHLPSGTLGKAVRLAAGETALINDSRISPSRVSEGTTRFVRCSEIAEPRGMQLIAHFQMGEEDANATDDAPSAEFTVDSAHPRRSAIRSGTPRYVSSVAAPGSTRAVALRGEVGEHYSTPQCVAQGTDNFCVSVWARAADPARDGAIVWNGDLGWGVLQRGDSFCAHFNGVGDFGEHKLQVGHWYHLVLVRETGFASFYVNGKLSGVSQRAPMAPRGRFWIGATNDAYSFHGEIDEVQVYLIAPGRFQIGDILGHEG